MLMAALSVFLFSVKVSVSVIRWNMGNVTLYDFIELNIVDGLIKDPK